MLLEYLQTQRRMIEYMGSAVRTYGSYKSNVNNMTGSEAQDSDLHTLVKGLHDNQANIEKQLLNVTKTI